MTQPSPEERFVRWLLECARQCRIDTQWDPAARRAAFTAVDIEITRALLRLDRGKDR